MIYLHLNQLEPEMAQDWLERSGQVAPGITGKAFEDYHVLLVLINKEGKIVYADDHLKGIEYPAWIIIGDENAKWDDLERFIWSLKPDELKAIEVKED